MGGKLDGPAGRVQRDDEPAADPVDAARRAGQVDAADDLQARARLDDEQGLALPVGDEQAAAGSAGDVGRPDSDRHAGDGAAPTPHGQAPSARVEPGLASGAECDGERIGRGSRGQAVRAGRAAAGDGARGEEDKQRAHPDSVAAIHDESVTAVTRTLVAAAALAAVVIAGGLAYEATGGVLGTATPPFVAAFGVRVTAWVLPAAALLAVAVSAGPRLLDPGRAAPAPVAAVLFAGSLAVALAVNAVRRGPAAWSAIFDTGPGGSFEAVNEYLPGLPALDYGHGVFLDRFAETVTSLPVNVAGHPPGLILTLDTLGLTTPGRMAALCIVAAAAVAPLTYALARRLTGERRARTAGLLALLSPGLILFGTTSADAVYAALGTGAAALLAGDGRRARGAGAALLAVGAFFSWALLAIGAWAAVLAWRRAGLAAAVRLAAACAAAVTGSLLLLHALTGYDPIGTLVATESVYRVSLARIRPYEFWVLGSPVAWAVTAGVPIAAAALAGAVRRRPPALALAAIVVIAAAGGFTKAETERIWLFMIPLACVAAADAGLLQRRARWVLAALATQALAAQMLFDTVW